MEAGSGCRALCACGIWGLSCKLQRDQGAPGGEPEMAASGRSWVSSVRWSVRQRQRWGVCGLGRAESAQEGAGPWDGPRGPGPPTLPTPRSRSPEPRSEQTRSFPKDHTFIRPSTHPSIHLFNKYFFFFN